MARPPRRRARAAARARRAAPPTARPGDRGALAAPRPRGRRREPAQGRPPRPAGARPPRTRSCCAAGRSPCSRRRVETDVERFEPAAEAALRSRRPGGVRRGGRGGVHRRPAARTLGTRSGRRPAASSCARCTPSCCARAGSGSGWSRPSPTDEPAYRELMRPRWRPAAGPPRSAGTAGCGRPGRELGLRPAAETAALYDECVAGLGPADPAFVGRQVELARAAARAARAERGSRARSSFAGRPASASRRCAGELATVAGRAGWLVGRGHGAAGRRPVRAARRAPSSSSSRRDRGLLDAVGDAARSVLAELTPLAAPGAAARAPGSPATR